VTVRLKRAVMAERSTANLVLATAVAITLGCGGGDSVSPPNHAGSYTLVTVSGRPLPSSLGGESCVQPPLTVCSVQEFATSGSLVLDADNGATFTDVHRTDITTGSGTQEVPTTKTWTGTYSVSGTVITLLLTSGGETATFTGTIGSGRVTMDVPQPGGSFTYVFEQS
jgi:hypothetical protein